MKKILLILMLLLVISSCKDTEVDNKVVVQEDTTRISLVRHLLNLRNELDHIETRDSLLSELLMSKKSAIDSMVDRTLDLKENKIGIILVTRKYDKVVIEKNVLVQKVDSIHKENVKLYGDNYKLEEELTNQRFINNGLSSENKNLKNKVDLASSVGITGVRVIGIGYTLGLINKPKEYETDNASKIKNIKFTCILPPNSLAKRESKKITFIMYGVDNTIYIEKDTTVNYIGKEETIYFFLKTPTIIEKGQHRVVVLLNKTQLYNFFYNIK